MKFRYVVMCLMFTASMAWADCVPEVGPDHPMGFVPGNGGLIDHPIERIRALQKSVISFARGSMIEDDKTYYRGTVIRSPNPLTTINILKNSHDEVQTCRVSLSFFQGLTKNSVSDLADFGELSGFSARVSPNEVNMVFNKVDGRGMLRIACRNDAGNAPITYRTMAETLGIQFNYTAADLCLEETEDCEEV